MTKKKNYIRQAGFTIAEMAIVVAIGGIILAVMGSKFLSYIQANKISSTEYRISVIQDALGKYLQEVGRYPCTSSLTIAPGQPNYNREVAVGACSTTGNLAGAIIRPGARAVENPPLVFNNYNIRIGGVPVRSLNLPDEFAIDAWGNRFTYVVSTNLATPGQFFPGGGIIDITGFNDGVTPPVPLVNPQGSAHYLIISHGPDGAGARSFEGTGFASPCNIAGGINVDQDSYNCDFTPAVASPQFVKTLVDDTAPDTINFFHDYVAFREEIRQSRFEFPSNAVMAFNRSTCPEGWSFFPVATGRYLMGAFPVDDPATVGVFEDEIGRTQYDIGAMTGTANRSHNNIGAAGHNPALIIPYHVTTLYCQKN